MLFNFCKKNMQHTDAYIHAIHQNVKYVYKIKMMMCFPKDYPYKLRRVARRTKKHKMYYTNSQNKRMICKQLVKDPRLITLIDHFFAVSEKIKQTEYQKKEMDTILIKSKSMEEYAQVFCLKQVRAHYDRYENKSYVLTKELNNMLELVKELDFTFYKSFTAKALDTIYES